MKEAKAKHRVKSWALETEQFQVGPTGPQASYLTLFSVTIFLL